MTWVYESLRCLPVGAAASSEGNCWDGERYARWNMAPVRKPSCALASAMDCLTTSPYGAMPTPLTGCLGAELWTCLQPGSHVNLSRLPESVKVARISATVGHQPFAYLERCGQGLLSWRTYQTSLPFKEENTSGGSSVTWPRWGTMQDGVCLALGTLAPLISGGGGGVCYPTPAASTFEMNKSPSKGAAERLSLHAMARRGVWPTPTVHGNNNRKGITKKAGDGLATAVNNAQTSTCLPLLEREEDMILGEMIPLGKPGPLNPAWVGWLMGWPEGWTSSAPLETAKFQAWRRWHGSHLADLTRRLEHAKRARMAAR